MRAGQAHLLAAVGAALACAAATTAAGPVPGVANGVGLNGPGVNGRAAKGTTAGGVRLDRRDLLDVRLEGTAFAGGSTDGEPRGLDFLGAEFQASLSDGSSLALRVDGIEPSGRPGEDDVLLYTVSYATAAGRRFLCGEGSDGRPTRAIPLRGTWDERWGVPGGGDKQDDPAAFTFACEGFALAKCVHAGYKPWASHRCPRGAGCREVSLEPYHRACVRMLRADYCGDGTSYTRDGTLINFFDGLGIQKDEADWPFEAEWTPSGARCARRMRLPGFAEPPCWSRIARSDCGAREHFRSGTLLMNEDAPAQRP